VREEEAAPGVDSDGGFLHAGTKLFTLQHIPTPMPTSLFPLTASTVLPSVDLTPSYTVACTDHMVDPVGVEPTSRTAGDQRLRA